MSSADRVDQLTLLYRGTLESCNYDCSYCPFAKRSETPAHAARDAAELARFLQWCQLAPVQQLSVFFTPWGEALYQERYRAAIVELSRTEKVRRVAIQTNLAGSLTWLGEADPSRVGLWTTWHPSQVSQERFLANVSRLVGLGISHSVGVVGLKSQLDQIEQLRSALPASTSLWVNAFSPGGGAVPRGYYSDSDLRRLRAVDPLFEVGLVRFASRGRACGAGRDSLAVAGSGKVRRCHFIPHVRGNLYTDPLPDLLRADGCPRPLCDCHIGYVQLDELGASQVYGAGLLHRVVRPGIDEAEIAAYLQRAATLGWTQPGD